MGLWLVQLAASAHRACCPGHSQCTQPAAQATASAHSLLPRPQPVQTEPAAQATASAHSLLPRPQPVQTEPAAQATASANRGERVAAQAEQERLDTAQSRQLVRCDNRQNIITMSRSVLHMLQFLYYT